MSSALRTMTPRVAVRAFTSVPAAAASRTQHKMSPAANAVARRGFSTARSSDTGPLYNTFFKHTWTYTLYCVVGAIVLDAAFGSTIDSLWEMNNKGVSDVTRRIGCMMHRYIYIYRCIHTYIHGPDRLRVAFCRSDTVCSFVSSADQWLIH
jgi:hypothetical protein